LLGQTLVPRPDHVVIVVEENHGYSQIIGSDSAPYINRIVSDSNCANFTRFCAETHPSQPNYLFLFSGADQGVKDDNVPATLPFKSPALGPGLMNAGFSFIGYSEDLPSIGFNGTGAASYARKHNPWANWQGSGVSGIPDSTNQPFTSFPSDYSKLPDLCFVIPSLQNDMHDGSDPERISTGDAWLQKNFDAYIQWAKTHNSLFVLSWDENDNSDSNHIATLMLGPGILHGNYNRPLNHLNLLRTIEDMFGLPYCGASETSASIDFCWNNPAAIRSLTVSRTDLKCELLQNYPNPFNPSTVISYSLSETNNVRLSVFNILGNEVSQLVNGFQTKGSHQAVFNGNNLPGGIYFYKLQSGANAFVRKMTLLK
jgi:acid phosphatase